MIRPAPREAWLYYKSRLADGRQLDQIHLPSDIPHAGKLERRFNYVPCDEVLAAIRRWMTGHDETECYYFLTEAVGDESTDFVVSGSSLTEQDLSALNPGRESALVGVDGGWAIFLDSDGTMHVAGPEELFRSIKAASAPPPPSHQNPFGR